MTRKTMACVVVVGGVVCSLLAQAGDKKTKKPPPPAAAEPAPAEPAAPHMTMTTKQQLEYDEQLKDKNAPNATGTSDLKFHCKDDTFFVPLTFEPEIVFTWEAENGDGAAYCNFARYGMRELCKNGSDKERATWAKVMKEKIKGIHCYVAKSPKAIDVAYDKKTGILELGLGPKMNDNAIPATVVDFIEKNF